VLERFDAFYDEPAKIKNIVFQINAGSSQGLYEAGKVDIAGVSVSNLEKVQDPANPLHKELVSAESYQFGFLAFNVAMPPFDDPKIRRAFAMAINIDKIIEISLKNTAVRATGLIPKNIPGYNDANSPLRFDVEQAKKLLQESKYGSAEKLPPVTISVSGSLSPMQEAMLGMWKQNLGVEVGVEVVKELSEWRNRRYKKDMQMSTGGWRADYIDPQNFLEILFESKSSQNRSNYTNLEIDATLLKAAGEPDAGKRNKMYQDIEKVLLDDLPCLPLYMDANYYSLVKPYVRNYKLFSVGVNQWRSISVSR
jgi:oligopeptide transport system substrate-binding protein